jgi:hypothetical protein
MQSNKLILTTTNFGSTIKSIDRPFGTFLIKKIAGNILHRIFSVIYDNIKYKDLPSLQSMNFRTSQ